MTGRQPTPARGAPAFLARQFGAPSGLAGHVVTRLLARGNGRFNRWLVNEISTALPVPHTVIELGYGPAIALHEIVRRYPAARVTGIDPSPVARTSARRRNAALGYQLCQHMPPIPQRAFPPQGFIPYDSDGQLADVLEQAGFTRPEARIFGTPDRPMGRLALSVRVERL